MEILSNSKDVVISKDFTTSVKKSVKDLLSLKNTTIVKKTAPTNLNQHGGGAFDF